MPHFRRTAIHVTSEVLQARIACVFKMPLNRKRWEGPDNIGVKSLKTFLGLNSVYYHFFKKELVTEA